MYCEQTKLPLIVLVVIILLGYMTCSCLATIGPSSPRKSTQQHRPTKPGKKSSKTAEKSADDGFNAPPLPDLKWNPTKSDSPPADINPSSSQQQSGSIISRKVYSLDECSDCEDDDMSFKCSSCFYTLCEHFDEMMSAELREDCQPFMRTFDTCLHRCNGRKEWESEDCTRCWCSDFTYARHPNCQKMKWVQAVQGDEKNGKKPDGSASSDKSGNK